MPKSIYWGTLGVGLALLLAACGTAGDPPAAPVEEQGPAAAEISQSEAEKLVPTEEVAPTEEAIVPLEASGIETVEPAEEMMATEEAVVEEEMIQAEEENMAGQVATTEPVEAPREEAKVQAEPPDPTAEPREVAEAPSDLTPEQQKLLASLAVKGTPPELFNEVWLNSEPLKLEELKGQVVIVEFWTFG